ncbi:hypothetical protein F5141DRAFT_1065704 [Pisolithus sp. B1]|nr:hypothetical protein F5141DRAFT_1065704 [Pisolithus sp. B1]
MTDIAGECGKLFGVNPIWQAPGPCKSQDGGVGRNSRRVLVKANLTFVRSASCNRNDKLLGPAGESSAVLSQLETVGVNDGECRSVSLLDERGNYGNRLSPSKTGIASVALGNCKYAPTNGGILRSLKNVPSAFKVVLACQNLVDKDSRPLDLKLQLQLRGEADSVQVHAQWLQRGKRSLCTALLEGRVSELSSENGVCVRLKHEIVLRSRHTVIGSGWPPRGFSEVRIPEFVKPVGDSTANSPPSNFVRGDQPVAGPYSLST